VMGLVRSSPIEMKSEGSGQDQPATPAEQFKALRKEYDIATGSGVPLSDAEGLNFVGRVYKHHYKIAEKFLKLAQKYPNDPDCYCYCLTQPSVHVVLTGPRSLAELEQNLDVLELPPMSKQERDPRPAWST
jgi:aryl-alcohol dehydrogenase-like predicted oxidoreductase